MTDRYYRHPKTGGVARDRNDYGYTEPVIVIPAEFVTEEALNDPLSEDASRLRIVLRDALPEPEPPAEPMGKEAWVRDCDGDPWVPLRDEQWVCMGGGALGLIREWEYLVEDFGPVTIHDDDEGDDE